MHSNALRQGKKNPGSAATRTGKFTNKTKLHYMTNLPNKTQVALAFGSDAPSSMTSVDIESLTGSRHDSIKRTIERLAEAGVISLPPMVEVKVQRERRAESVSAYLFIGDKGRRDSIIVVAQLCPEFTARIVDRWQELEAKAAQPPVALTRMDILKLAMESEEARLKAEAERDHAIATKAQISDRKTATAMATASAKAREVKRLEHALGYSTRHATILQVEKKLKREFDYHPLRRWCNQQKVTPERVPDKRYGDVVAWPAEAWMVVYGVDLAALFCDVGVYAKGEGV